MATPRSYSPGYGLAGLYPKRSALGFMSSDRSIVGLLFAGSDEYTVVNKLKHVENLLDISLLTAE